MDVLPLKKLIAQDCLDKAMNKVLTLTEGKQHYNEAILLALKLITFQKAVIKGLFSFEEQNRIRVSIANQLLQFLDFLEEAND